MPHILICGPNGAGKSTLGRCLSPLLSYPFFDIEDYYFPKTDPERPYQTQRPQSEVHSLLFADMQKAANSIVASVRGNIGAPAISLLTHVICITISKEESLRRVKERSYQKFGTRALPDGDLYESEEAFFRLVKNRPADLTQKWLDTISLPILYIDGFAPPDDNAKAVADFIQKQTETTHDA